MSGHTWRSIALLTGFLLAGVSGMRPGTPAGAQDDPLVQANGLTRGELANVYRTLSGASLQPPPCVEGEEMFTDVPFDSLFCPWIEELARRGITGGCTATQYCPGNPVSRAQMAVFVVKAMEACPTIDPTDEMIRVGGVCVDKYEASIWDAPVGGNQITGPIPCSENGEDCDNIWARSVAGVDPTWDITWFQAQQALANSGKRLPTNGEWQMVAAGTPDPGDKPGPEDCHTDIDSADPVLTGARVNCVSRWGAHDMVGNVEEWVADWDEVARGCETNPQEYGEDLACVGRMDGDSSLYVPGAFARGGDWNDGADAGPLMINGRNTPSGSPPGIGFRGAR